MGVTTSMTPTSADELNVGPGFEVRAIAAAAGVSNGTTFVFGKRNGEDNKDEEEEEPKIITAANTNTVNKQRLIMNKVSELFMEREKKIAISLS
jgi:hypothetical protein